VNGRLDELGRKEATAWSGLVLFEMAEEPSEAEFRETLAVVQRYLVESEAAAPKAYLGARGTFVAKTRETNMEVQTQSNGEIAGMQGVRSGWGDTAEKVNNAFLAPLIIASNASLVAVRTAVGGTAIVANLTARAVGASRLPLADAVENITKSAADTILEQTRKGIEQAAANMREAITGGSERSANQLLAETLLDDTTNTSVLPLSAAWAAALAANEYKWFQQVVQTTIMLLSSALDTLSQEGVLPDSLAPELSVRFRLAMARAALGGPLGAVRRDFSGMVGGLAALFLGDPSRLAKGAQYFRSSMEYVYEKKLHGEVQPKSDFPLREALVEHATQVVERFPHRFVEALERGDPWEIVSTYLRYMGDVNTLILRYPLATYNVLAGVSVFVFVDGYTQVEDAYSYALCELAIVESRLSNEEKDWALEQLRGTAPKSIVGYEYYIPLLVPFDGTVKDKSYRRNSAGEIINDHTTSPSVFPKRSIELAQAMHSELTCLRAFLWLYRDEEVAREKNLQETVRKFGPGPAQRIAEHPLFPLTPEEIAALTCSGPRTQEETDDTLDWVMRGRGLLAIADGIQRGAFVPGELL